MKKKTHSHIGNGSIECTHLWLCHHFYSIIRKKGANISKSVHIELLKIFPNRLSMFVSIQTTCLLISYRPYRMSIFWIDNTMWYYGIDRFDRRYSNASYLDSTICSHFSEQMFHLKWNARKIQNKYRYSTHTHTNTLEKKNGQNHFVIVVITIREIITMFTLGSVQMYWKRPHLSVSSDFEKTAHFQARIDFVKKKRLLNIDIYITFQIPSIYSISYYCTRYY